jgi:hypothetical protein
LDEIAHVKTKKGGEEKGGVQNEETNKNLFHYFYSQINSKVGNILTKATSLHVNLR